MHTTMGIIFWCGLQKYTQPFRRYSTTCTSPSPYSLTRRRHFHRVPPMEALHTKQYQQLLRWSSTRRNTSEGWSVWRTYVLGFSGFLVILGFRIYHFGKIATNSSFHALSHKYQLNHAVFTECSGGVYVVM